MKKKLLALLVAIFSLFLLTACKKDPVPEETGEEPEETEEVDG